MSNKVQVVTDPHSIERYAVMCNLLTLLGNLTVQSAQIVLDSYTIEFEEEYHVLGCCDNVLADCHCHIDYPDYDYYNDFDDKPTPSKDEPV